MERDFDRLLAEIGGHFDELIMEIERVAEQLASEAADLERLRTVRSIAERGATLTRMSLRVGSD